MSGKELKRIVREKLRRAEDVFFLDLAKEVIWSLPISDRHTAKKYFEYAHDRMVMGRGKYGVFYPGKHENLIKMTEEEFGDIPVYLSFFRQENNRKLTMEAEELVKDILRLTSAAHNRLLKLKELVEGGNHVKEEYR